MQLVQKVQLYGIKLHGLVFTITESGLSILTEKCPITIPFLLWEYLKFSLRKHFSDFHAAGMCWLHFPDSRKKKKKKHVSQRMEWINLYYVWPGSSDGKESACSAGDLCLILESGRCPGGGNGNPLQYSCLENPQWTEEPGGLQSMGSQRVGHDWGTNISTCLADCLRCSSETITTLLMGYTPIQNQKQKQKVSQEWLISIIHFIFKRYLKSGHFSFHLHHPDLCQHYFITGWIHLPFP